MSKKPHALIIDDEPDICELLSLTLQAMDIDTATAGDLAGAQKLLGKQNYDICLTDMRLPDGNGLELVEWMQTHTPDVPVAVITAHGNVESAVQALKLGAFDFVSKPVNVPALRKLVQTSLQINKQGTFGDKQLLGNSPAIAAVREMVAKVARSQAPVHISGESGTGKELVARLIHESGPRANKPFVPVNCGAIPGELMESEFFGHKKGSFTGAVADKNGLFVAAEGGTLFLDEVADLPLHMQVKLLRVIQEKAVRPVGETIEQPVDVRLLSATHRNLADQVQKGHFREDLFYRINVIEMSVPALRNRGEDIDVLANHFLARLGAEMGIDQPTLSDAALSALRKYSFPGNVRELENILERALTLSEDGKVNIDDVQLRGDARTAASQIEGGGTGEPGGDRDFSDTTLIGQLNDVQRDAIVKALEEARYNKTKAAKILGISFRALRYRIKKLGIE
ncbi:MAG: sigma-54-dependent Fis family transcriptional regulator [Gammaproteobacteria bacterium]|nr:sigma-54-dependent Fis family transcriptional regulator [Gammaproteobacteria bacterium]